MNFKKNIWLKFKFSCKNIRRIFRKKILSIKNKLTTAIDFRGFYGDRIIYLNFHFILTLQRGYERCLIKYSYLICQLELN